MRDYYNHKVANNRTDDVQVSLKLNCVEMCFVTFHHMPLYKDDCEHFILMSLIS